jgi:hypothetical protein
MIEVSHKMTKTIQPIQFSNRQFRVELKNLFRLFTIRTTIILDVELPFADEVTN